MRKKYPTSDGEIAVAERKDEGKGNNILKRNDERLFSKPDDRRTIPVRIQYVIKDEPESYTSFSVKLLSDKIEWMPYEHCSYVGDILLVPEWFYQERLSQGRW